MNTHQELFDAIENGELKQVQRLVQTGVPLDRLYTDIRYRGEMTALHFAVVGGNLPIIQCLIENGAPLNATCNFGFTPLHYAARDGNVAIAEYLVRIGASVNVKDNTGWTPLHYASDAGLVPMTTFLLEKGADFEIIDEVEKSAKDVSRSRDIKRLLEGWKEYQDEDIKEPMCD